MSHLNQSRDSLLLPNTTDFDLSIERVLNTLPVVVQKAGREEGRETRTFTFAALFGNWKFIVLKHDRI